MPDSGHRPRPPGPSPASAACRRSADGLLRASFFGARTRARGFKKVRKACAGIWASFEIAPSRRRFGSFAESSRLFRSARVSIHIRKAGLQQLLTASAGLWAAAAVGRARSPASVVAASNHGFFRIVCFSAYFGDRGATRARPQAGGVDADVGRHRARAPRPPRPPRPHCSAEALDLPGTALMC